MILTTYVFLASLATLMVAQGIWVPAILVGVLALGFIFAAECRASLGSLRRRGILPDRRSSQRPKTLG